MFSRLLSNFVCELIFKRIDLGLKIDNFCQISTVLLPFDSCRKLVSDLFVSRAFLADCLQTLYMS